MKTPYHDDNGVRIKQGMWVGFTYGIPPIYVKAEVVRQGDLLIVLTLGHKPPQCRLSDLRELAGSFYQHTP